MEETTDFNREIAEPTTYWEETQNYQTGENQTSLADEVIFYYKLLVCIVGLFGNLMNIVVIQYTKVPKTTRITISILAISDFSFIVLLSPSIIYPKFFKMSYFDLTDITCQLSTFATLFFAFVSGLMVAVLTVERVIAVTFPLHAKLLLSVKRLLFGLFLFILVGLAISIYISSQYVVENFYDENNNLLYSSCQNFELGDWMQYFGVLITMVIPPCIVVLGNIIIIATIVIKKKQISTMTSSSGYQAGEIRLVITTISISVSFIILSSPLTLYYTLGKEIFGPEIILDWTNPYYLSCNALFYTNFAINFFLYIAFTSSFRTEFGLVIQKWAARCGISQVNRMDTSRSPGTTTSSLSSVSQRLGTN